MALHDCAPHSYNIVQAEQSCGNSLVLTGQNCLYVAENTNLSPFEPMAIILLLNPAVYHYQSKHKY